MKFHNIASAVALAAIAMISTSAMAGEGAYVGGSVLSNNTTISGSSATTNGSKVFTGYNFNQNFGFEVGYADMGTYSASGLDLGGKLLYVDAVANFDLNDKWAMNAHLGLTSVNATATAAGSSTSETDSGYKYGLGVTYAITPQVSVFGSFDQYAVKVFNLNADTTSTSIGLTYKF